jgi:hypothetical protein
VCQSADAKYANFYDTSWQHCKEEETRLCLKTVTKVVSFTRIYSISNLDLLEENDVFAKAFISAKN